MPWSERKWTQPETDTSESAPTEAIHAPVRETGTFSGFHEPFQLIRLSTF